MKYATRSDIVASFEYDFFKRFPKDTPVRDIDPKAMVAWIMGWLDEHKLTEVELGDAIFGDDLATVLGFSIGPVEPDDERWSFGPLGI